MPDLVRISRAGPVTTIQMNRPEKRNALNAAMVEALQTALEAAGADDGCRVVVLTGAGKAFSAGADLASLEALQTATPQENLADSQRLARLFETIYRLPKPVIAKITGHAIAGGCGLASVCDFSLASDRAKFGFTEVRIGFVPAIVMVFVLRKIGEATARPLFLRGHLVDAEEAKQIGLIHRVVAPEDLEEATLELALELARETSASAIALTKSMLASVQGMGLSEGLEYATKMNAFARSTTDCKEGVAAFLQKQAPPWKRLFDATRPGGGSEG